MTGIKETSEVIIAANELAISIVKAIKDGFSISDIPEIIKANFENVKNAIDGCGQVTTEVKELDTAEIGQLVALEVNYIPKIIEVLFNK
ncbi:hypothetical protein [Caudoviricetes sp.]|nr:hypothetical protein [Caudoviricetes sp.]